MKGVPVSNTRFAPIVIFLWMVVVLRSLDLTLFTWPFFSGVLLCLLYTFVVWTASKKREEIGKNYSRLFAMGVFIGLLIHPQEGIWQLVLTVLLAALGSQLKWRGTPLVFPATFGLVIASSFAGFPLSWWGVVAGGKLVSVLLYLYFFTQMNHRRPVGIFLAGYSLFFLLFRPLNVVVSVILDPSVAVFATVLLPELLSLVDYERLRRVLPYGVLGVVVGVYLLGISFGDPLLFAVLLSQAAAVYMIAFLRKEPVWIKVKKRTI